MPSSSTLFSLAGKLSRAISRPQPLPPAHTLRCFSSKGKDKAKGKGKEKEAAAPPPASASAKKSSKKPHWSQLVFYKVSPRLAGVMEKTELTRPEAIERIWEYIKSNNLQNDDEIVCDEALKKAFGQAKVQRTEILKYLDVNLTRLKPSQVP
eukprot:c19257_g1_i1 orf=683-1138(-)